MGCNLLTLFKVSYLASRVGVMVHCLLQLAFWQKETANEQPCEINILGQYVLNQPGFRKTPEQISHCVVSNPRKKCQIELFPNYLLRPLLKIKTCDFRGMEVTTAELHNPADWNTGFNGTRESLGKEIRWVRSYYHYKNYWIIWTKTRWWSVLVWACC